jgi:capsular exopolysaccharide synthesis family protein
MSKVYEALRQKGQETPQSEAFTANEVITNADQRSFPTAIGITDEVLQVAFAPEETEKSRQFTVRDRPSDECVAKQKQSLDGYRRLSIGRGRDPLLVLKSEPHGLPAEQFRFLRRTLEQRFPNGAVLLLTSPAPNDGKTLTSVNLCSCLAESGQPSLLVEGDIRQPTLDKVLGVTIAAPGIEDVLAGSVEPFESIYFLDELSIYIAMVADPPPDPSRVVSGAGTQQFVKWVRERFKWVVIDSPPVLQAADVAHLATLADAVLLVVRARSTPRELTMKAFEMIGDHLGGVILNEASVDTNPYYRYLYDYRPAKGKASHSGATIKSQVTV